ncbi:MAG: DUF362 domain-containing protein [Clostridia bacterium]|nr:DUF362 domain-containing protein [Clostridia bacterium]MBR7160516.1 DUF362 domain-containing protein [Clostridia bacterium]
MMKARISKCDTYDKDRVEELMMLALDDAEYDFSGKVVLIKANLVSAMSPDKAATTHPVVVGAVAKALFKKGAKRVIIGDSPGNMYTKGVLAQNYKITGMQDAAEDSGAELNWDFGEQEVDIPEGISAKKLHIIDAFINADAVVNCCKLKTHALTGFSGATKNYYGLIPGLIKAQLHATNPDMTRFSNLLVDIQEYAKSKTVLHVIDGIVGMDGEGPTAGNPKQIGVLISSKCPYSADIVAIETTLGKPEEIPYLNRALERGLIDSYKVDKIGSDINEVIVKDFRRVPLKDNLFALKNIPAFLSKQIEKGLVRYPIIPKKLCKGCGKCATHCPVQAIKVENKVAVIDYDACIKCFCCQELCPFHIVKIKKPLLYRLVNMLK